MNCFRILQLTDLHVFQDPQARLKNIPTWELLQDVVQEIRESGTLFDAVVITGDHTHDELPDSYRSVRNLLQPWLDRLFQVPGNHDDRPILRSVFADRIAGVDHEPVRFHFMAGSWLCLGMDTHLPGSVPGQMTLEQINWARELVSQNAPERIVVFMHHPPIELGSPWMDRIGLTGRELFQNWVAAEPRVSLVVCGHVHHASSRWLAQAEVVTTPSTGIQFSPEGETPHFVADPPGYRIIELSSDGYQTSVRRLPVVRYVPCADT